MATKDFGKLKSFSELFNVDKARVDELGFFDITPAIDSALYIDAKLLNDNILPRFKNAATTLKNNFNKLLALIIKIDVESAKDPFWRAADKFLTFTEIQGTCLGYSEKSTAGKGIGKKIRADIISNIRKIISKGFIEPELMSLICVFTDNFGCDLSSDLVTFLIKDIIFEYNLYLIKEMGLDDKPKINYMGYELLNNPYRENTPIILVPRNILSELPVCLSFEDVPYACQLNEEARQELQTYIDISEASKKSVAFQYLLNNKELIGIMIEHYCTVSGKTYDYEKDPLCVSQFRNIISELEELYPNFFGLKNVINKNSVRDICLECLTRFKHFVEDCGGRNRLAKFDEKGIQFLFYAMSYYFCSSNGIDLCPEVNHGKGPVDFYFTNGTEKISVEFKKSTNQQYIHGLAVQLPEYMKSNSSNYGYYVFINFSLPSSKKIKNLIDVYNMLPTETRNKIELYIIQSNREESASKKKLI